MQLLYAVVHCWEDKKDEDGNGLRRYLLDLGR